MRAKIESCSFICLERNASKKCSAYVSYDVQGVTYRGIVRLFLQVTQCSYTIICNCPAEYFALIQRLGCSIAFQTLHPTVDTFSVFSYDVSNVVDKIPLRDIRGVCINLNVSLRGNKNYLVDLINKHDYQ